MHAQSISFENLPFFYGRRLDFIKVFCFFLLLKNVFPLFLGFNVREKEPAPRAPEPVSQGNPSTSVTSFTVVIASAMLSVLQNV